MSANTYLSDRERRLLAGTRVGIAGAGGLGSNVAAHLVRAGVEKLAIADFDVVSESNLNRQFFFRDQIGRRKVEALAENLRRIDPSIDLRLLDGRLDETNMPAFFADCGIVVEAFDRADAKAALLRSIRDRPVVAASGIAGWGRSGEMALRRIGRSLYLVGDGASDIRDGLAPQSARVGIAAAVEANTVLALLLGMEP